MHDRVLVAETNPVAKVPPEVNSTIIDPTCEYYTAKFGTTIDPTHGLIKPKLTEIMGEWETSPSRWLARTHAMFRFCCEVTMRRVVHIRRWRCGYCNGIHIPRMKPQKIYLLCDVCGKVA